MKRVLGLSGLVRDKAPWAIDQLRALHPRGHSEVIGAVRDVTERKQSEETLSRVRNELAHIIKTFADDPAEALATYQRILPAIDAIMGVPSYGATTAKGALQLAGVLDNRHVRQPLLPLDDAEFAALREGLTAAGLL